MNDLVLYFLIGIALVMIVEGFIYALFAKHIKKMTALITDMPIDKLRAMGGLTLALGALLLWLLIKNS